jgi:hypothetical protein
MSSKQATITSIFQVAFDNGATAQATLQTNGEIKIEAKPPQTRQCTNRKSTPKQCKNRVPLDSKYKRCDHCRGINKKSKQKRVAAFRANPVAQAAAAAQVVVPEGHVRCSHNANAPNWCKRTFSNKSKFKTCDECRESIKKSEQKRRADPEVRAQQAEYNREYKQTPAGKASQKRNKKKPVSKLRSCLLNAFRRAGAQSRTLKELGTFSSNEDIQKHFESTFKSWMNWDNHGNLRHDDDYHTVWHIGHKIPCAVYNLNDLGDVRKCFDRRNLYAQDAKYNMQLQDRLALTDEELEALKPIWPNEALIKGMRWFKTKYAQSNENSRAYIRAKVEADRARVAAFGESALEDEDEDDYDACVSDDKELFDDEVEEEEEEESEEEESEEEEGGGESEGEESE